MKKSLIAVLSLCSTLGVLGQGAVQFSNTAIPSGRIQLSDGYSTGPVPTTPGLINYGLFYGIGESTSLTFLSSQLGVNSTSVSGFIASPVDGVSPLYDVSIPGTSILESDVWIQVKGWSASFGTDWHSAEWASLSMPGDYYGQSETINVFPLGNPEILGTQIWQVAAGTNPNHIHPFTLYTVPEPSVYALAGLAGSLLLRKRAKG